MALLLKVPFMNKLNFSIVFLTVGMLHWSFPVFAQSHKGISFQAVIRLPSGEYPTRSGLVVNGMILSPNGCVLREEQFTDVNVSNGYLNLPIGSGHRTGNDPGLTMKEVMDNSKVITHGPARPSGLACFDSGGSIDSGTTSFVPDSGDGRRKFRLTVTIDSVPIAADFNIRSMAFAINSESADDAKKLNGKSDASFVQVSNNVTQASAEAWFASSVIGPLISGTYNAPSATTISTTLPVSKGGTGLTAIGSPNQVLGVNSSGNGLEYKALSAGSNISITHDVNGITINATGGGMGTITGVTAGAGLSGGGNSGDVVLSLSNLGTPGSYYKVITDAQGRVSSGQMALTEADIPGLSASKVTSGTFSDSMLSGISIDKLLSSTGKWFNYKPNSVACADDEVLKYDSDLNGASGGWKCATDLSVGAETDPSVQVYAKNPVSTGLAVNGSNQLTVIYGTTAGTAAQGNDSRIVGAFQVATPLGGDLSGNMPSPTVEKIRNQSITAQGSLAGQVLRYAGGGNWTPGFVAMTDLRSTVTGSNSFATNCGTHQTLSYNSVGDFMSCQSISITKSQVSDFPSLGALASKTSVDLSTGDAVGVLSAARFPALTGDVTTIEGAVVTTISNNVVTNTKFRQGLARSVVGVAGNGTSNVADIQGTTNQVLRVNSSGTSLEFGAINLASAAAVSGSLSVANGGTGVNTLAMNSVVLGNGTSAVQMVSPGPAGNVLASNGTTWISQPSGRTSCPTGFTLIGTSGSAEAFCISTNEEPSATWLNATTTCYNKSPIRARLCSASEWAMACVSGLPTAMTGNWEWVAELYSSNGHIMGAPACDSFSPGPISFSYPSRCCFR